MVFTSEETIRNRKTDNSSVNGEAKDSETSNMAKDNVNNPSVGSKSNSGQNGGEKTNSEEGGSASVVSYNSAGEYAQAVQQWIQQYHLWNNMQYTMCMMPWYAMTMAAQQSMQHQSTGFGSSTSSWRPRPAAAPQRPPAGGAAAQPQAPPPQARAAPRPAERPRPRHPVIFRIPSLWKRVLAEFIDFVILFIIKLGVTMLAVEHLGSAIDLERYDIDFIFNPDLDYNTAISMTSELIMMEVINRVFICFFETLCLHRGLAGQVGGSTPGKRIMGLRLVSCEEITAQPNNLFLVTPAGDVGLWNAFIRAVIKNFSMAFFFPVCLTVFFFQRNRAAYDVISNSAVVEPLPEDVARGF